MHGRQWSLRMQAGYLLQVATKDGFFQSFCP
ncbi:Uncharacterised protein [Mycobacteroides abscessus subsp. abscessus]|nr:Uncharacterised protein [Mycobacteroides abscessus subsp. abscessus]